MIFTLFLTTILTSNEWQEGLKEIASSLSHWAEKSSPTFFALLADYCSENWGGSILLSPALKKSRLSFGCSFYGENEESGNKGLCHLAFTYPILKRPEWKFGARYGFVLPNFIFLPGNPYRTYKIKLGHSLGFFTSLGYPIRRFKPYLLFGFSISNLRGELIEDLLQKKTYFSKFYLLSKARLGFNLSFLFLELGREGYTLGVNL